MKVYIDITELLKQPRLSGIQRAVIEHIKALYKAGVDLVLVNADMRNETVYKFFKCDRNKFFDVYINKVSDNKKAISTKTVIEAEEIVRGDVFLDLDLPLGSFDRKMFYKVLSDNKVVIITAVYDMIPMLFPETCDNNIVRLFSNFIGSAIAYSNYIIVNTENTKNDIINFVKENKLISKEIVVVPLGSDYSTENFKNSEISERIKSIVQNNKYLLSVGTIEPRKNHKYSFDAFKQGLFDEDISYVIVGKKGWKVDELYEELVNNDNYDKSLFILEDISDYELDYLYKNAYFTLFPTHYEGFGLPVVESIQRGVPVLTSDIPVMREVGSTASDYFDLNNVSTLVDLVKSYKNDSKKYDDLLNKVKEYHVVTWDESGEYITRLINDINLKPRIDIMHSENFDVEEIFRNIETRANKVRVMNDNHVIENNIGYSQIDEHLHDANLNYHVTSYYELKTDRKFGKLIIFGKRILRKFNKAIVEIPLEKQTKFNTSVVRYLNDAHSSVKKVDTIEQNINNLSQTTNGLINQVATSSNQAAQALSQMELVSQNTKTIENNVAMLESKVEQLTAALAQYNNINNEKIDTLNLKISNNIGRLEFENLCINVRNNNDLISKLLSETSKENIYLSDASYSQSGEDMIIKYIFSSLGIKFEDVSYIDVGANNPVSLNNTYWSYTKGARGVLVEPNKDLIPLLMSERGEDIVLNCCVDSEDDKTVALYKANIHGLSTVNEDIRKQVIEENNDVVFEVDSEVKTITVDSIIENVLNKVPDFISIDVEGHEMNVLRSIDFSKYRPKLFVIEMIEYTTSIVDFKKNTEILEFMESKGYIEYCFNGINSIFVDKELR